MPRPHRSAARNRLIGVGLKPIVAGTEKPITQLDSVIETGDTGVPEDKQALDRVPITQDNADQLDNFVSSS